jgi:hypothetical protein
MEIQKTLARQGKPLQPQTMYDGQSNQGSHGNVGALLPPYLKSSSSAGCFIFSVSRLMG